MHVNNHQHTPVCPTTHACCAGALLELVAASDRPAADLYALSALPPPRSAGLVIASWGQVGSIPNTVHRSQPVYTALARAALEFCLEVPK